MFLIISLPIRLRTFCKYKHHYTYSMYTTSDGEKVIYLIKYKKEKKDKKPLFKQFCKNIKNVLGVVDGMSDLFLRIP